MIFDREGLCEEICQVIFARSPWNDCISMRFVRFALIELFVIPSAQSLSKFGTVLSD